MGMQGMEGRLRVEWLGEMGWMDGWIWGFPQASEVL